jgi:hypothetical protein
VCAPFNVQVLLLIVAEVTRGRLRHGRALLSLLASALVLASTWAQTDAAVPLEGGRITLNAGR